jgi:hypothetical protein
MRTLLCGVGALGLKGTAAVGQKGVKLGLIRQKRQSIPGLGELGPWRMCGCECV